MTLLKRPSYRLALGVFVTLMGLSSSALSPVWITGSDQDPAPVYKWDQLLEDARHCSGQRHYDSAVVLANQALEMAETALGTEHEAVATVLHGLGRCLFFVVERTHKPKHIYKADNLAAETTIERALHLRRQLLVPDDPKVAETATLLADLKNIQGKHRKAEELYREALEIKERAYKTACPEVAFGIRRLARVLKNQGRWDESAPLYDSALAMMEGLYSKDDTVLVGYIAEKALIYRHLGEYDKAERLYRRALKIRQDVLGGNDPSVAKILDMISSVYHLQEDYTREEQVVRQSIAIYETAYGPISHQVANCLHDLAVISRHKGKYSEAERLHLEADSIFKKVLEKKHPDVGLNLSSLAELYEDQGRFPEAASLYKEAMKIMGEVSYEENGWQAEVLIRLASVYLRQGENTEAELALNRAYSINKSHYGGDHPKIISALLDLSKVYECQKHLANAESTCRRGLKIAIERFGQDHIQLTRSLDRLAEICRALRKFDESETSILKALHIRKKYLGVAHLETAKCMSSLANLYRDCKKHRLAEETFLKSIRAFADAGLAEHPALAECQNSLATMLMALGRHREAATLLENSLTIYEMSSGAECPGVTETAKLLAQLHAGTGEFGRSLEYFSRFLSTRQAFIESVFPHSSAAQKLRWTSMFPLIEPSLVSMAVQHRQNESARLVLDMALRGKAVVIDALMAERKSAFCSLDPDFVPLLQEHRETRTAVANIFIANTMGALQESCLDSLERLHRLEDSLATELSWRCAEFKLDQGLKQFSIDDIAVALGPHAVLWEFLRYTPESVAPENLNGPAAAMYVGMVLDPSGDIALVDLGEANGIDSLIDQCLWLIYRALSAVHSPEAARAETCLKEVTAELYERLFAPMVAESGGKTRLYISPDGPLNLLPFHILWTPESQYVIETYSTSYLSSGRDLLRFGRERPTDGGGVLVADPDFDALFLSSRSANTENRPPETPSDSSVISRLLRGTNKCRPESYPRVTFTRQEAEVIARTIRTHSNLPVIALYGPEATEDTLKALTEAPKLLHLATHGYFCSSESFSGTTSGDNPLLRSGLVLSGANRIAEPQNDLTIGQEDGILTAFEVSELNLMDTELATLSACETGVGEVISGEGVFGLRRAFQHAGAQAILMSLWKVPDESTSELMQGFYSRWLEGDTKTDALRYSALELLNRTRQERGHGHPLLWGGFVLAGNPN